jgi:hypothetical protein
VRVYEALLHGRPATLSINVIEPQLYEEIHLPAVDTLRIVSASEFRSFDTLFHESSVVLAYSWLDSFLGEIEEALYLHNPANLGDNVQIKLGKILNANSIDEVIHDLIRRRVRERSQWSLPNRVNELRQQAAFKFSVSHEDLEWASDLRNNIVHNRHYGAFQVSRRRVSYRSLKRESTAARETVARFLGIAKLATPCTISTTERVNPSI